ncbi:MAG TPA: TIGR02117 family protein [Allosphingosinicella sp.]|nr:TIGR02117 family protein [Allosphingosinicella sp.]
MRRALRIFGMIGGILLATPLLYLLAALILCLVPANAGWHEAKQGIRIFVRTNGVHTWIMVPKVTAEMDWRPLVPGKDLKDPRWGNGNYVAIGYGNRQFYLNTPHWADLSVRNAFWALSGSGDSLIHADHDNDPQPSDIQRPITLSHDEYLRLVGFMRASFRLDARGHTIPLIGRGYGDSDVFYEAVGSYSAFYTCNSWTGAALRAAGVRTGVWTPLSPSIMWRLE